MSVKMGSERGSYANLLCQFTAATAESFAVPVLDVFPYTITWTEESTCNAGNGVGNLVRRAALGS